jgi:mannose-6-phosphate isomerase-like protein (cupin superfamily)
VPHVDAMAAAGDQHLEAIVHQALAVHALAHAGLGEQVGGDLFEHAGADAAQHIFATLALEDHGIDAGPVQQLAQQQTGGAGTNDGYLCTHAAILGPIAMAGLSLTGAKLDFSHTTYLPSAMTRRTAARRIPAYFLYGEAPRRVAGPLLHVETIEARSARHHWKIEPHLHHALHQLVFVVRGRGVVLIEGERSQYRPPALMLMPAGTVHGFEFEPGTTGHVVSVSTELAGELAQREPGVAALFARPATLEIQQGALRTTDLAQAIRLLAREFGRADAGDGLALHGWLCCAGRATCPMAPTPWWDNDAS